MKRILLFIVAFLFAALVFNYFISQPNNSLFKFSKDDPFKNTIVESQFFEINSKNDTLIEARHGTKVVFQKQCFVDAKGNVITGEVKFELAEALTLDEMVFSNLTTTSNNQILETGGMIFINAYYKNNEVFINKEKPIYIEIPTNDFKPKMMKYKGVRDTQGNMNWIDPKPLQNYLIPIAMELLDFLPSGFEKEVREHYKESLTSEFIDSTYYQLEALKKTITERGIHMEVGCVGINPRKIQTIKSKEFQNTFLATKEFEKRLQYLFINADNEIVDLYINNLDKNLWEVDRMVADNVDSLPVIREYDKYKTVILEENPVIEEYRVVDTIAFESINKIFLNFASQRKTNVKNGIIFSKELKKFYETKFRENQEHFKAIQKKLKEKDKLDKKILNVLKAEYDLVLKKREKYRMETYGFIQTEKGWVNIDRGTEPKNWKYQEINVTIENNQIESETYVYAIYQSINSLLRLKSKDTKHFRIDDESNGEMPTYKDERIQIVSISSSNEKYYFGNKQVDLNDKKSNTNEIKISLKEVSKKEIEVFLQSFKESDMNNNIQNDLDYLEEIKKEESKFLKQEEYIKRLEKIAFRCIRN